MDQNTQSWIYNLYAIAGQGDFSSAARSAFSEFGLPHSISVPKETAGRLAGGLRPSGFSARETFVDPQRLQGTIYKAANGYMWATPRAFVGPDKASAPWSSHRKGFLSNR